MAPDPVERKLAAILSADAVEYSRLMAEDEAGTIRTLTAYREQIGTLVREHRGRVVDSPGDNVLAEFPTALDAAQAAIEIQRVIGARNADLPAERRMEFRVGVHQRWQTKRGLPGRERIADLLRFDVDLCYSLKQIEITLVKRSAHWSMTRNTTSATA